MVTFDAQFAKTFEELDISFSFFFFVPQMLLNPLSTKVKEALNMLVSFISPVCCIFCVLNKNVSLD